MKAILLKEIRGYFTSPIGYVFVGIFMLLCALVFIGGPLTYQEADLSSVFSNINIIYLFLVSILTMRLMAEEKNKKTDQLLITAPVSVVDIVLGKYLAAMAVFGITIVISFVFPIILFIFGNPSIAECIGSYAGFILLWGVLISIGLFISSLTESQMIAAVFTFAVMLFIYFLDSICANISNTVIANVLQWFSLLNRYTAFQNGMLNLTNVIYYLSFIFVFLFLTVRVIEKRR